MLEKITDKLPRSTLTADVKLEPTTFDCPGPIDVLLGADLLAKELCSCKCDLCDFM